MPRRLIRSAVRRARRTAVIAGTAGVLAGRAMDDRRRRDASARRHKHYQAGPVVAGADRRARTTRSSPARARLNGGVQQSGGK